MTKKAESVQVIGAAEFDMLEELAARGLSAGTALSAATRDVMVKGVDPKTAAAKHGTHASHVRRKVERLLEVRGLILSVYKTA